MLASTQDSPSELYYSLGMLFGKKQRELFSLSFGDQRALYARRNGGTIGSITFPTVLLDDTWDRVELLVYDVYQLGTFI